MFKIDKDITPVKIRKCKNTQNPEVIESNIKPLYIIQKQDSIYKKPRLLVLKPIERSLLNDVEEKFSENRDIAENTPDSNVNDPSSNGLKDINVTKPLLNIEFEKNLPKVKANDKPSRTPNVFSVDTNQAENKAKLVIPSKSEKPVSKIIKFEPIKKHKAQSSGTKADKATETNNEVIMKRGIDKGTQTELVTKDDIENQKIRGHKNDSNIDQAVTSEPMDQLPSSPDPNTGGVSITIEPVKKCVISPEDFPMYNITINNESVPRTFTETLETEYISKLSSSEYEIMRKLIQAYHDEYARLKAEIDTLKEEVAEDKKHIERLEKRPAWSRRMSRVEAIEILTKNMPEDAKMLLNMQVEHLRRKRYAKKFTTKEKIFSLALYQCSKEAYNYLSSFLAFPKPATLKQFTKKLFLLPVKKQNINKQLEQDVKENSVTNVSVTNVSVTNISDSSNEITVENSLETGINKGLEDLGQIDENDFRIDTPAIDEYAKTYGTIDTNNGGDITVRQENDIDENLVTLSDLDIQMGLAQIKKLDNNFNEDVHAKAYEVSDEINAEGVMSENLNTVNLDTHTGVLPGVGDSQLMQMNANLANYVQNCGQNVPMDENNENVVVRSQYGIMNENLETSTDTEIQKAVAQIESLNDTNLREYIQNYNAIE